MNFSAFHASKHLCLSHGATNGKEHDRVKKNTRHGGGADLQQSCTQEHRDVRRVRGGGAPDGEEHDRSLWQHRHRAPRRCHVAGVHPLREPGENDSLRRDALALFRSGASVVRLFFSVLMVLLLIVAVDVVVAGGGDGVALVVDIAAWWS